MSQSFKFGDILENGWAGNANPSKRCIFIRLGYRRGRLNPGKYAIVCDMKGKQWEQGFDGDHKLVKIGSILRDDIGTIFEDRDSQAKESTSGAAQDREANV